MSGHVILMNNRLHALVSTPPHLADYACVKGDEHLPHVILHTL